jgi:YHS domain-containing protein
MGAVMHPLRIFILVVLFFILYKLLFGRRKKKKVVGSSTKQQRRSVAQDILVEDPVCHSYVPKKQAVQAVKNGETYYFCSEKCCKTFLEKKGDEK